MQRAKSGYAMVRIMALGLALLTLAGCGVTAGRGAGYARLSPPADAAKVMGLSLGALPLKLARIVMDDDPEVAMILKGLRGVRVYVYELDGGYRPGLLQPTLAQLHRTGWDKVVAIREDGEDVHVLLKTDAKDRVRGMVVLAADGHELTMVNLMGTLRPEMFNAYMEDLSIDAPAVQLDSSQTPATSL